MNFYTYCHQQYLAPTATPERIAEYAKGASVLALVARSAQESGLPYTLETTAPCGDETTFCDIEVTCATFAALHDFLTRLRWGCGLTDCGIVTGDHVSDEWAEIFDGVCDFAT